MDNRDMTVHIGHDNEHDHDHGHAHGHNHPVQPELKQHRRTREELTHIKGWGADLDHKNRPAVPMERTPPRLEGAPRWAVGAHRSGGQRRTPLALLLSQCCGGT